MPRILVVDDDDGVRTLLEHILSAASHEIDEAASVQASLALLERNYYNLLLSDLMLPDGSGYANSRGSPPAGYPGHHRDGLPIPFSEGRFDALRPAIEAGAAGRVVGGRLQGAATIAWTR